MSDARKREQQPFSDLPAIAEPETQPLKTVLIVEDSPIDRELYQRYLLSEAEPSYQILEADSSEMALQLCRSQPDVILLDYRLPDIEGLEFLRILRAQIPDPPPVVVVTGQGNESIAVQLLKAGAEDYLVKSRLSPEELQFAIASAIQKGQLQRWIRQIEADRQQHIQKERIINQISQQVLRSLDLNHILQTTVQEVRQFLQTDRVIIFTFESDREAGQVVAESVVPPWTAVLSSTFHDPCFNRSYADAYQRGRVMTVADVRSAGLEPCHLDFLERIQVRANLVVPILEKEMLWGLLIAQHCAAPREWKSTDVELLQQLATHVGIAIQQADAYAELSNWNQRLATVNTELQITLEELQVTEEELRIQHEQVAHEQQRYQNLFNFAPDGYLITSATGQIQEANQAIAALLEVEPQFLIDQPLVAYLPSAEEQQLFYRWLNQPDCFHQVQSGELLLRSPRGKIFPAEVRVAGTYDSSNQLIGLRWQVRDITRRKQAEAEREQLLHQEQLARTEAERANRVKDEFLAVLSHELRSPLNPILGWTTLLRSQKLPSEKVKAALDAVDRNARLQAQLIEDLLDISRIMSGKLALDIASVDVASVLSAALETVQLAATAKSIQLNLAIDPDVGCISGDATRLQQVFWNLLSNAVKFTPNGGRVEVRLEQGGEGHWASGIGRRGEERRGEERRGEEHGDGSAAGEVVSQRQEGRNPESGDAVNLNALSTSPAPMPNAQRPAPLYAQITITDTGKGIHPDFLPHVFDYFRQEDASTTRRFGGLGLGLSIARQIVEMHGGTVAADSKGEGHGATFTVKLPLLQSSRDRETAPSAPLPPRSPASPAPLTGLKILIVDDEPDTREFLTFLLQDGGATVTVATCASEVLQTIEQFSPDLIVSDIGMPEMDGYMLMQTLRRSEQMRSVPAIALTAYASESDQQQALTAGFQRHATKPIDPGEIILLIRELIDSK